ncbi:biotin/lipoyl-binding carrier protein [Nocardia flavorosea]|uniref:Biotin/lipoyl-binding carrier protein n=1 Tax=Nocardia flavorosea TaxID=53429 RepID=A0A846YC37_9NOCA|nr:biotin/lipoyl-binding carrier protein [Nocardia flavorosea]NKY55342.1 biotin/lipoyl-binding carrier protein [Nocardia flavorosea]
MAEEVRAEMVSTVLTVEVTVGDRVATDQTLVLLESMKMEIPVLAEVGGSIASVAVEPGQVLQAGDLIAVID